MVFFEIARDGKSRTRGLCGDGALPRSRRLDCLAVVWTGAAVLVGGWVQGHVGLSNWERGTRTAERRRRNQCPGQLATFDLCLSRQRILLLPQSFSRKRGGRK